MNRPFADTVYYLRRAIREAREGVVEEVEPVETRVRELTGGEREAEPTRMDRIEARLRSTFWRVVETVTLAVGDGRRAIRE